jgi:hypothetical protein
MLESLGVGRNLVRRVSYFIAHHHTYTEIDAKNYQILTEADFFANVLEDKTPCEGIEAMRNNIFKRLQVQRFCAIYTYRICFCERNQ